MIAMAILIGVIVANMAILVALGARRDGTSPLTKQFWL